MKNVVKGLKFPPPDCLRIGVVELGGGTHYGGEGSFSATRSDHTGIEGSNPSQDGKTRRPPPPLRNIRRRRCRRRDRDVASMTSCAGLESIESRRTSSAAASRPPQGGGDGDASSSVRRSPMEASGASGGG